MSAVKRHTTRYQVDEDRLHLFVERQDGSVVALALTRRLLNRVVPALVQRLEQTPGAGGQAAAAGGPAAPAGQKAAAMQRFAQTSAVRRMTPQPSVQSAEGTPPPALVRSVDIQVREGILHLILRDREGGEALQSLPFSATNLRQWLGVVRGQYRKAAWEETFWPVWMASDGTSSAELRLN